ncbi:MAG: hypothetical protein ABH843_00720 [Candidatus Omnitrophota bacterium]
MYKLLLKITLILTLLINSAGEGYALQAKPRDTLRPAATKNLGYMHHIKTIDVYVGCNYVLFGRFGELSKGILWAKELSRRFPDKKIRLVLHIPSLDRVQKLTSEALEKFWPKEERIERYPNVTIVKIGGKKDLYDKFYQADLGILINFANARAFNFRPAKMELLVSLNDTQRGRLYADSVDRSSMLNFGLSDGRLGLLLEDELLKKSEIEMSKKDICDGFKKAQVNAIFNDPRSVSHIINTKWSAISAHTPAHFIQFLRLMKKYRSKKEEISVFVCGKSATNEIFYEEYDLSAIVSACSGIKIVDIDGQTIGHSNAKITLYFLNTVPWGLMLAIYKNCEKPVLVRGERPIWEAGLAGVPWLYEIEHWNQNHFDAFCRVFESCGKPKIATALRDFSEAVDNGLEDNNSQEIRSLFENPDIGKDYRAVAEHLFKHANFFAGDKLERTLNDKTSRFLSDESVWLSNITQVARAIKETQFPLKSTAEEAKEQLSLVLSENGITSLVEGVRDYRYKHIGITGVRVNRRFSIKDNNTEKHLTITLFPDGSIVYKHMPAFQLHGVAGKAKPQILNSSIIYIDAAA